MIVITIEEHFIGLVTFLKEFWKVYLCTFWQSKALLGLQNHRLVTGQLEQLHLPVFAGNFCENFNQVSTLNQTPCNSALVWTFCFRRLSYEPLVRLPIFWLSMHAALAMTKPFTYVWPPRAGGGFQSCAKLSTDASPSNFDSLALSLTSVCSDFHPLFKRQVPLDNCICVFVFFSPQPS